MQSSLSHLRPRRAIRLVLIAAAMCLLGVRTARPLMVQARAGNSAAGPAVHLLPQPVCAETPLHRAGECGSASKTVRPDLSLSFDRRWRYIQNTRQFTGVALKHDRIEPLTASAVLPPPLAAPALKHPALVGNRQRAP